MVASGNGGQHNDNCNYDGYANSIYTVTIGSDLETVGMGSVGVFCISLHCLSKRITMVISWRSDRTNLAPADSQNFSETCSAIPQKSPTCLHYC